MDENEFFRQATLRICGKLDIKEALMSSLKFLRQRMPVDSMLLQLYEGGLQAVHTVGIARMAKVTTPDLLTPMTDAAREEINHFEKEYREKSTNFAWLIREDPHRRLMFHEMLKTHKIKATSLLVLPLKLEDRVVGGGAILLTTEGDKKFTPRHADLVSLLKEPFAITMSNALKHREINRYKDLLADDNRDLRRELRRLSGDEIIGENFGLKEVMSEAYHVAAMNSPVLLLGETGVGKDIIANAIHYASPRKEGPFVKVNCGAIPESLIDSELFGHEKGAFTGAMTQKRGRFERAHEGTIFLDEIGELPPQAQVRLLHVLQDKEIERVGGNKPIQLDIRIIAATNRDLEKMISADQFREDLWFRLNVFPIRIPPLRERKSDIPVLLQHFINIKSRELKLSSLPTLSSVAMDPLLEYNWPGNVRELENVIERSLILNPGGPLTFEHLKLGRPQTTSPIEEQGERTDNLDEIITQHIRRVLIKTEGKVHGKNGAAILLGMNPSTLRHRMRKLGIEPGRKH